MSYRCLAALALVATPAPAFACAACGCTLASDWLSQNLVVQPGTTLALRYDLVPQTQLRSAARAVPKSAFPLPNDAEIEQYTDNHYLTASVDEQLSSDWGVNLQLPFLYRPHATVSPGDTAVSSSRTGGFGDARVSVRYQGFATRGSINGLQLGLVLPTGAIGQSFRTGPQAGTPVDRTLQPGAGSLQLFGGYYRLGKVATDVTYLLQLIAQAPLTRRDGYTPGAALQLSGGIQYTGWRGVTPQLYLNFRAARRDRGLDADPENTGGEQLYLAPGASIALGRGASAFTWVQLPLYQHVNGLQLAPRFTASVGVQYRL